MESQRCEIKSVSDWPGEATVDTCGKWSNFPSATRVPKTPFYGRQFFFKAKKLLLFMTNKRMGARYILCP
jgi:hypothetical protein